jgi:UDP-N-acetylglucosamine 4-epimerase
LNQLFAMIQDLVGRRIPEAKDRQPDYRDFRPGDVRHSLADIGRARQLLGYEPSHSVREGLALSAEWYLEHDK